MQPTANKEYLWRPEGRAEAAAKIKAAKIKKGITYKDLAERVGVSKAWLACAIDGQQWVPQEFADKIAQELGVSAADVAYMTEHPYKGYADPILYRLHEVFDTFGPALKDPRGVRQRDHERDRLQGGRRTPPGSQGDRIIITFDGKCLPYSLAGKYPW